MARQSPDTAAATPKSLRRETSGLLGRRRSQLIKTASALNCVFSVCGIVKSYLATRWAALRDLGGIRGLTA